MLKRGVAAAACSIGVLVAGCSVDVSGEPVAAESGLSIAKSGAPAASTPRTSLTQLLVADAELPGSGQLIAITKEALVAQQKVAATIADGIKPASCAAAPIDFSRIDAQGKARGKLTVTLFGSPEVNDEAFERAAKCPRYETKEGGKFTMTRSDTVPGTVVPARAVDIVGATAGQRTKIWMLFATVRSISVQVTALNEQRAVATDLFNAQVARVQAAA